MRLAPFLFCLGLVVVEACDDAPDVHDEDLVLDALFHQRPVLRTLKVEPSRLPVSVVVHVSRRPGRLYSSPCLDLLNAAFDPGKQSQIEVQAFTVTDSRATLMLSYGSRGVDATLEQRNGGWTVAAFEPILF